MGMVLSAVGACLLFILKVVGILLLILLVLAALLLLCPFCADVCWHPVRNREFPSHTHRLHK